MNNTSSRSLKEAFEDKKILLTTHEFRFKDLRKLFLNAKLNTNVTPAFPKYIVSTCRDSIYHKHSF